MPPTIERHVTAIGRPAAFVEREQKELPIAVIFTSVAPTLAALKKAGMLANRLHSHIQLLVPQVVPYPLPLHRPPVPADWSARHFQVLASESPVETTVKMYYCRDRAEVLAQILRPHSLVVLGGRKRWWPTPEKKLARKLREAGHEVIFTETE